MAKLVTQAAMHAKAPASSPRFGTKFAAEALPPVASWLAATKVGRSQQLAAVQAVLSVVGGGVVGEAFSHEPGLVEKVAGWEGVSGEMRQLAGALKTCGICLDRIPWGECCAPIQASNGGESWSKTGCRCMFCQGCYSTYVEGKIKEHRVHHIPCPSPECPAVLFEGDVQRATSSALFGRYKELRSADHTARLQAHEWSDGECPCPRCSVILFKSHGCDSMACVCGHKFNWASAYRQHQGTRRDRAAGQADSAVKRS